MHPVTRINLGLVLLITGLWWIAVGIQIIEHFRGPLSEWYAFFPFLVWFLIPGISGVVLSYGFLRSEAKQSNFYRKWIRRICLTILSVLAGVVILYVTLSLACPPETWD